MTEPPPPEWAAPGEQPPPWQPPGQPPSSQPPPVGGWPGPAAAPRPGVIPLRPLAIGEILDGAISYIRANPAVTLGLSAVVITITQLLQLPAQYLWLDTLSRATPGRGRISETELAELFGGFATLLVGVLLSSVAVTMLTGLLIVVLSGAVLGRKVSLGAAWAQARPRLPGLLGLTLLTVLLVTVVFLAGFGLVLLAAAAGVGGLGTGLLALVLVPAGICLTVYLWVALSMAAPAYVLEGIPVMASFGRSMRLVRSRWWPVFGTLLLAAVIAGVIGAAIGVPFALAGGGFSSAFDPGAAVAAPTVLSLVISAIGTIIAGTVTAPFSAGVTGLLYFDQRMRREALDIELARAAYGQP